MIKVYAIVDSIQEGDILAHVYGKCTEKVVTNKGLTTVMIENNGS